MKLNECVFIWFRRDLRLDDNVALFQSLTSGKVVVPLFIFDRNILEHLPEKDARVAFIHDRISQMHHELLPIGSTMLVRYGNPVEIWKDLIHEYDIKGVYSNHDYEPYAKDRDKEIRTLLESRGIHFHTYKDQVIFEKKEILTGADKPYSVFTPYSKKWKSYLSSEHLTYYDTKPLWNHFAKQSPVSIPTLSDLGFSRTNIAIPSARIDTEMIKDYAEKRNFPAEKGTTRIGIHLRFGTISIRQLVTQVKNLSEAFLNELIWREFYMQILWNYPHVADGCFRKEYEAIPWNSDTEIFEKWCQGKTGFPIVDAGMRQLNETGYMHNRVRMITASFLVKDLLCDWRWGEAYFAEKLLDFELSSNNGGWQWAAGCGTDAAPYFRIFNPQSQLKKFDPKGKYVHKWVPEAGTPAYPSPIVDHKAAREKTLEVYKTALASAKK